MGEKKYISPYSSKTIRKALHNYLSINQGDCPGDDYEASYKSATLFIYSDMSYWIACKVDIDNAIDKQGTPGQWHRFTKIIGDLYPELYPDDYKRQQKSLTPYQRHIVDYIYQVADTLGTLRLLRELNDIQQDIF